MKYKLYIIHGWAYDTGKWGALVEFLRERGVESVLLAVPGLTAPLEEVWTLDDYVRWLNKVLENEKQPVVLLGHSNGGRISLAYALQHPERVKQLILIDSAGIYHNELPIRMKRLVFRTLAKLGRKIGNSERWRGWLHRLARESDYRRASPIVRKTMRNLIEVDLAPQLSRIHIPTVIIWGEDDRMTPLRDGRVIHERIAGSSLEIIAGAKHSPQFTHAEKVGEIVAQSIL